MSQHDHYWKRAQVLDGRGVPSSGRRCDCGMETIGGLNAEFVRVGQRFHDAMVDGINQIGRRVEVERTRRYEP